MSSVASFVIVPLRRSAAMLDWDKAGVPCRIKPKRKCFFKFNIQSQFIHSAQIKKKPKLLKKNLIT